VTYRQRRRST